MQAHKTFSRVIVSGALMLTLALPALSQTTDNSSGNDAGTGSEVSQLKEQIASQQRQIEQLRAQEFDEQLPLFFE